MIDLITVVFREEIPFLKIQAQSINQYLNSVEINTITIVVNDTDDVVDLIDPTWFTHPNVKIVPYSKWNYTPRINGWENQQLCKLLAAGEAQSEWSLVLDSKTWFVKPFRLSELFDSNGRGRVGRCAAFPVFKSSQDFVESLYEISMPDIVGPHGVPFLFHTATAKELIASEIDFIEFFQTNVRFPHLVIEFHLYTGFVLKKYGSLDTLYSEDQVYHPVNIAHFQLDEFDDLLSSMYKSSTSTASIHRKIYELMTPEQFDAWDGFIQNRLNISVKEIFDERFSTIIRPTKRNSSR